MAQPDIYCLMVNGGLLSEGTRDLLLWKARELVAEGKEWTAVSTGDCEGMIETEGKHVSVGTISGQVFTAQLAIDHPVQALQSVSVSFMVRVKDLAALDDEDREDLDWSRGPGIPDADLPEELRPRSRRSRLN